MATYARCAVAVALVGLTTCKDATRATGVGNPTATPTDPSLTASLIVSHVISLDGVSGSASVSASSSTAAISVAYVSLPPGTIPDGITATIANRRSGVSVTTPVLSGGFDPQQIPAVLDDTIDVHVTRQNGGVAFAFSGIVRYRPPRVVRTNPPQGQTDVPVNRSIQVVFSEPISTGAWALSVALLALAADRRSRTLAVLSGAALALSSYVRGFYAYLGVVFTLFKDSN